MNRKTTSALVGLSLIALTRPVSAQEPQNFAAALPLALLDPSTLEPKIQFQTTLYDFSRVKVGGSVKYTFFLTNTGDTLLIISNVQPQCGCTTAGEWSHQLEPGETGIIPVQFNSGQVGGQVIKSIMVSSNDKLNPSVRLQLKGTVWKPVDMHPTFAVLNFRPDATNAVNTTIRILNNLEEPLTLGPPESTQSAFTTEIKTNSLGRDFELLISLAPPFPRSNLQGRISMKTSAADAPLLSITVVANLQNSLH